MAMGAAVRGAITEAGLSQARFAERTGFTIKTLGRRLSGSIPFTYPEIKVSADALGMSAVDLVERAERELPPPP